MRRVVVNDFDMHDDPSPLLPRDGFTVVIEEAAVMRCREFGAASGYGRYRLILVVREDRARCANAGACGRAVAGSHRQTEGKR